MACGDGCEAEPVEEGVGQRDTERRAVADPPRAMGTASGLGRQELADSEAAQRREAGAPMLPVSPDDGAKPPPYPLVETEQEIGNLAESEVVPPPDEVAGQLRHETGESDALRAARQFPNPHFDPGERLRRDDPLGRRPGRKAESQEGPRRRAVYRNPNSVDPASPPPERENHPNSKP